MSIKHSNQIKALEEKTSEQSTLIAHLMDQIVEQGERLAKLEQRKKPGPKPKATTQRAQPLGNQREVLDSAMAGTRAGETNFADYPFNRAGAEDAA